MTDARTRMILDRCGVPRELDGKSVLDVGCNTGDFSIECEKRGAKVVGIDVDKHTLSVARGRGSQVEFLERSVYDIDGEYDYVLFFGVLYHLRHPLLAIERLRSVVREACFVEAHVLNNDHISGGCLPDLRADKAISQFGAFSGDPTNWFAPNVECVLAWFRACDFDIEYKSSWDSRASFRATPRKG